MKTRNQRKKNEEGGFEEKFSCDFTFSAAKQRRSVSRNQVEGGKNDKTLPESGRKSRRTKYEFLVAVGLGIYIERSCGFHGAVNYKANARLLNQEARLESEVRKIRAVTQIAHFQRLRT
ncbi:hypothetical protein SLA2020_139670 [Shorea laevis]